jgi:flagellar hook-associated protein 3 FlgL
MRVSTTQFAGTFKNQLQVLQARQLNQQKQIATGLKFSRSSEDPVGFQRSQQIESQQSSDNAFLQNIREVRERLGANHLAMTDLQRLVGRAGEIAVRANQVLTQGELNALATEIDGIIDSVLTVANRQKDGDYLFGGTSNTQPINISTDAYQGNTTVTSAEIESGKTINTGLLTGGTPALGPVVNGFLYDSGTSTDVLASLRNLSSNLKAGNISAIQSTGLSDLNKSLDLATRFVGQTAAQFTTLDLSEKSLQQQIQTRTFEHSKISEVNITDAIADLQQTQFSYQAALQTGSRILNLTILDYL